MNILSKIIENVTKNFYQISNEYHLSDIFNGYINNSFNNYINVVKAIDDFSYSFSTDLYHSFIKEIESKFFNSEYRKRYCEPIKIDPRNTWTLFGEISFERRYYYDSFKKKYYYFVDELLMLPKNLSFDLFVCAKVCEISSIDSMAKAGRTVSELIGKRFKLSNDPNRTLINRATARNIVRRFKIPNISYKQKSTPPILYILFDEHFVPSQFNQNKDFMVKAAVIFEDVFDEYKSHKKKNSKPRLRLSGKRVEASIDGDLMKKVDDYIYNTYDVELIQEIVVMGDCASWITSAPSNFHYHKDLKVIFAIDGFHYHQALEHICTTKYDYMMDSLKDMVMTNNKKQFIKLCNFIINQEPARTETITEKQNYILNNWKYIQNYYHKIYVKCSMEAHVSHVFADIFTSRPRAYSEAGLRQILKLRLLRVNGEDIQQIYLDVLRNSFQKHYSLDLSSFYSTPSSGNIPYWLKKKADYILIL